MALPSPNPLNMPPLDTPVVFMVFNRPEPTRQVFAKIREAQPKRLFVICDGPRPGVAGEAERVDAVRAIVAEVDWECEVERNYSLANLGCRNRISSGIDWVFERCDEAIFLEDDCLPDITFFPFCSKLLEHYRNDERVALISGDDFLDRRGSDSSYRFSGYALIWGWATWRRTWERYDVTMKDWPRQRQELTDLKNGHSEGYWRHVFDETFAGKIDTWDFQLVFSCLRDGRLCVVPEGNLVSNIGFGEDATNLKEANHLAARATRPIHFPLRHPRKVRRDRSADREVFSKVFAPIPRIHNRLMRHFRRLLRWA